jgi:hypothetical protein
VRGRAVTMRVVGETAHVWAAVFLPVMTGAYGGGADSGGDMWWSELMVVVTLCMWVGAHPCQF